MHVLIRYCRCSHLVLGKKTQFSLVSELWASFTFSFSSKNTEINSKATVEAWLFIYMNRNTKVRLEGERGCNTISLISWKQDFTVPRFSIFIYKKNYSIPPKIPSLWELSKFYADLKKSFPDAKINVWLHYSLGGEPAELSRSRREGLCTALGSLLTLWVCQQSFGERWYTGLYLALGTAKRSTKTPSYKQDTRHKFSLSQTAQQLRDCTLH